VLSPKEQEEVDDFINETIEEGIYMTIKITTDLANIFHSKKRS